MKINFFIDTFISNIFQNQFDLKKSGKLIINIHVRKDWGFLKGRFIEVALSLTTHLNFFISGSGYLDSASGQRPKAC